MKFHLVFAQNTKSPYYVGDDRLFSLWKASENILRNMDKNFRSAKFEIPQFRLDKPTGKSIEGFVIECSDIVALSVAFGEIAKMISIDATVKFPVEIHPEGLTDTYSRFLI